MIALLFIIVVLAIAWHIGGVDLERYEIRARYRTAHLRPHADHGLREKRRAPGEEAPQ